MPITDPHKREDITNQRTTKAYEELMAKSEDPSTGKERKEEEEVLNFLGKLLFPEKWQTNLTDDNKKIEQFTVLRDLKESKTNLKDVEESEGVKKYREA